MCQFQLIHSAPIAFLRGLQARCCWAATHGGADADSGEAHGDAYAQGIHDFECGRAARDVPPLLADVAELAAAWREGWNSAKEMDEMSSCPCCQDPDIDVCPIHG